jgi:hypothetical protein
VASRPTLEARLLNRADALIRDAEEILSMKIPPKRSGEDSPILGPLNGLRRSAQSFFALVYEDGHPLRSSSIYGLSWNDSLNEVETIRRILITAREEIAAGLTQGLESILAADVFASFLDMASYLLEQGYKDAAAVIAGGVLEGHLRRVAISHGISVTIDRDGKTVPQKADALNAALAKGGIYNQLDLKTVTAWLSLRNHAAHGAYDSYNADQVRLLIAGVLDFASRVQ